MKVGSSERPWKGSSFPGSEALPTITAITIPIYFHPSKMVIALISVMSGTTGSAGSWTAVLGHRHLLHRQLLQWQRQRQRGWRCFCEALVLGCKSLNEKSVLDNQKQPWDKYVNSRLHTLLCFHWYKQNWVYRHRSGDSAVNPKHRGFSLLPAQEPGKDFW